MDYDERYRQDGRSWFSSCSRKEDLLHWYSREDAKRLLSHGFVFTRYLATEYREYDQQTVFIKETCLYREEIDFESLWKSSSPGNAAALRDALNQLRDWALLDINENAIRSDEPSYKKLVDGIIEITNAALSAPARNCDRFKDIHTDFSVADSPLPVTLTEASREQLLRFIYWLFAPAEGGAE